MLSLSLLLMAFVQVHLVSVMLIFVYFNYLLLGVGI